MNKLRQVIHCDERRKGSWPGLRRTTGSQGVLVTIPVLHEKKKGRGLGENVVVALGEGILLHIFPSMSRNGDT